MRSRYSAHTTGDIKYIRDTMGSDSHQDFDEKSVREWANKSEWLGLKILSVTDGKESDQKGVVEFVATYKAKGKKIEHHEVSTFKKDKNQQWYFVDGDSHVHEDGKGHHHHHEPVAQVIRESPKIGRNDPCSCGSGKKFKKCCGA